MGKLLLGFILVFSSATLAASPKPGSQTFVGSISDSMCGAKHMMPGGDKACADECVKSGAKYILANSAHDKLYNLDDQTKAAVFSGQQVKVTGTLNDDTIQVKSIVASK